MQLFNTKVVPAAADDLWEKPALPDLSQFRLLVISKPFADGSAEEQTLQKMMSACKLSPTDYFVFRMPAGMSYSWQTFVSAGAPKIILLLGVMPAELAIHALFRLHAPNAFADRTIIPALSLSDIEKNPTVKKELWSTGLKPAFGL